MTARDRTRLETLGHSAECVAAADEVLRVWDVATPFVTCTVCGRPCLSPDVRRRRHRRKTPPAELFEKSSLGFADAVGAVVCWPCDDARWQ